MDKLELAIAQAPLEPVIHASAMAGYEGAPLYKKLGIRSGAVVYLIDAPKGFEKSIPGLPDDVSFVREDPEHNDLAIWFVDSQKILNAQINKVKSKVGKGGLWIAWPKKASGVSSDLTQTIVRKKGLSSGFVDYKVCSIDETWTGLKFALRQKK
jgi:hypothetical protein